MGATWLDPKIRRTALAMVSAGVPRIVVCEELGLKKGTLWSWIDRDKKNQPIRELDSRKCRVKDVRRVCDLLDEGYSLKAVGRITGRDRCTLRKWRDDPRFREATLEFDPCMTYDDTDLLDRATVAHHLCHESSTSERWALLAAVVGDKELAQDDRSPSTRWSAAGLHGSKKIGCE